MLKASSTPYLFQYPVSSHRGYNNDSGTVFKNFRMTQYKGAPKIDDTQAPVPSYDNVAAETRELKSMNDGVDAAKLTAGSQEEMSTRGLYIEGGGVDGLQVLMTDTITNMADAPTPERTTDGLASTDAQYRLEVPRKFALTSKKGKNKISTYNHIPCTASLSQQCSSPIETLPTASLGSQSVAYINHVKRLSPSSRAKVFQRQSRGVWANQ